MKKPSLDRVKILLADGDAHIARIVISSLNEMGFKQIHHVQNSTDALIYISKQSIDILITEWLLEPMNGIEMVKHLRLGKNSPNRSMPIIMLTGKGELIDVTTARDVGITEFLVKPFTIQNLYDRIAYLVDHPRNFVLSKNFAGPDRRRRAVVVETEVSDRRKMQPKQILNPSVPLPVPSDEPMILPGDQNIRRIAGLTQPLSSLITPKMLEIAQRFLDESEDENLKSVKGDLAELEQSFALVQKDPDDIAIKKMQSSALAVKSRSGTFGFVVPSKLARILYLFLERDYKPVSKLHNNIVQQSIEAMKVIFATGAKEETPIAKQLVAELEQIVAKISKT